MSFLRLLHRPVIAAGKMTSACVFAQLYNYCVMLKTFVLKTPTVEMRAVYTRRARLTHGVYMMKDGLMNL